MTRIRSVDRQRTVATPLAEAIIELDKANMEEVFAAAGRSLPVERRRKAFAFPGTVVVIEDDDGSLIGYLEYGPDFDDHDAWYISSIQIARPHRGTSLLLRLLRHALRTGSVKQGAMVKTHVQLGNAPAIRLIERFGFRIDDASSDKGTASASAIFPLRSKAVTPRRA